MNCQIKGCKGRGFIGYGGRWICGECMMKIFEKENEKKKKMLEELDNDN